MLDFTRVTGVDSSAVVSFVKMSRLGRSRRFDIVLTGIAPVVERQLRRGALASADNVGVLPDLDRGVQWCEDRILQEHQVDGSSLVSTAPAVRLVDLTRASGDRSPLSAYLEEMQLAEGHVLFREGDSSTDVFFVQSGRLTALLEQPDGRTVRLRTMGPGTMVGEMALYRGGPRTASVVADVPSTVYRLSKDALEMMEQRDPRVAAEMHKTVARLLAERLATTVRTQRAFMD